MAFPGAIDQRRLRLKAATAGHHQAVDAILDTGCLLETTAGYRRYLTATLQARRRIEDRLTRSGAAGLYPAWPGRRIADLVERDLADLVPGTIPRETRTDSAPLSAGSMIGALYVLEGSAMGARLIARRVAAFGMRPDFGARHLNRHAADPQAWPRFLAWLEGFPLTGREDAACLREAVATFECFRTHYGAAVAA